MKVFYTASHVAYGMIDGISLTAIDEAGSTASMTGGSGFSVVLR